MSRRKCPDCESFLGVDAKRCRCGWREPVGGDVTSYSPAPTLCGITVGCARPARSRIRLPGQEQLLPACDPCALAVRNAEAERYMAEHGLTRRDGESKQAHIERLRAFVLDKVHGIVRKQPTVRAREPGEDEDYHHQGASRA